MNPYDEVFIRLKAGDETRRIARSLHRQASLLTKQGSGRGLGQGHGALSAICAFLASKRLGNGEVTRDQACAVACVDPKTFDATSSIVESVLRATPSAPRLTQLSITYQSLLKLFGAREDAFVPMLEVEETLRGCGALVDGGPIDLKSPLMKGAIFYWVCTVVLGVTIPDAHLRHVVKASPYKWSASQRVLEQHCSPMVDDLTRKAETAISGRETRSQMRLRTKEKIQPSTTSFMAQPGELSVPLTPIKSALVQRMKRKTPAEVEAKENGSPSKRAKENGSPSNHDTPMTTTGRSDTSTPTSLSHSRPGVRARVHVPLAVKELSYPIHEDEMPRRRRRNLRSAFLNPGVYGWKPAACTSKKLERARKWESLMVGKYGDPWDAW